MSIVIAFSIGEIFSIIRMSKEGLRQLHKTEQAYEKKLNSFQVILVGVVERASVHSIHTNHSLRGLGSVEWVTGSIINIYEHDNTIMIHDVLSAIPVEGHVAACKDITDKIGQSWVWYSAW